MADAAKAAPPDFETLAKERYPKGGDSIWNRASTADAWLGEDGVPRPDKTLAGLRKWSWLGFLGIDHFYLGNPITGVLKMITFGGFLLWWLWDILQVRMLGPRVCMYGLSLPFDIVTGIGQGRIVDGETVYGSKRNFSAWQAGSVFSIVGLDSLINKDWGRFFRKIFELIVLWMSVDKVTTAYANNGIAGVFESWFQVILAALFGTIVFTSWFASLSLIAATPAELMVTGFQMKPDTNQMVNVFNPLLDKLRLVSKETRDQTKLDMNYGSISAAEFVNKFGIRHKDAIKREEELAQATTSKSWIWSVFVWMSVIPGLVVQAFIDVGKYLFTALKALIFGPVKVAVDNAQQEAADRISNNPAVIAAAEAKLLSAMGVHINGDPTGPNNGTPSGNNSNNGDPRPVQGGGARDEGLSTESMVLGATVAALIGGGALKYVIDNLVDA